MEQIGGTVIPLSTEFAIREAVRLLRLSRMNFKSGQVEQARELLEIVLADLPPRPAKTP
jgi:hypothetical protein